MSAQPQIKMEEISKGNHLWASWALTGIYLPISIISAIALFFSCVFLASWVLSVVSSIAILPALTILWYSCMLSGIYYTACSLAFVPDAGWLRNFLSSHKSRPPTMEEEKYFAIHLNEVLSRLQAPPVRAWNVRVTDEEGIAMAASISNTFFISEFTLENLKSDQLSSTIAHELGHHLLHHPSVRFTQYFLMMPVDKLRKFIIRLSNTLRTILAKAHIVILGAAKISRPIPIISTVMKIGAMVVYALICTLSILARLLTAFIHGLLYAFYVPSSFLLRRSEFSADRVAVKAGLGDSFIQVLTISEGIQGLKGKTSRNRIVSTHPPLEARVDRIKKEMAFA